MEILYINLENYFPSNKSIKDITGLKKGEHYNLIGTSLFLHNIEPGIYGKYLLKKYIKIPAHYTYKNIIELYPEAKDLKWPCYIGRYEIENITFDIVFGKEIKDDNKELRDYRSSPIDNSWNNKQKYEYLFENYGYYNDWTYDLLSNNLAKITMEFISILPEKDRVPYKVVRHLTSMMDQSSNAKSILYGRWDGNYSDGISPCRWNSVKEIFNTRAISGVPVKYAQCWIFAETLVAMFRFLGIPSRSIYVENAHIDVGCDKGVDFIYLNTKGDINIKKRININVFIKDESEIEGIIYPDSYRFISKGDLINDSDDPVLIQQKIDLGEIIQIDDKSWNFHMLAESYIERPDLNLKASWNVCDSCPMPDILSSIVENNKYFGPTPVHSIREGTKKDYDYDFLFSTFFSLVRKWDHFIYEGKPIIYPFKINYDTNVIDRSQVKVLTRDIDSLSILLRKQNITSEYRYEDFDEAYNAYHKEFPILFIEKYDFGNIIVEKRENMTNNKHLVQIIYLNKKTLLSCHRKIYTKLDEILIPICPKRCTVISILTIDLVTKKFWPQVFTI